MWFLVLTKHFLDFTVFTFSNRCQCPPHVLAYNIYLQLVNVNPSLCDHDLMYYSLVYCLAGRHCEFPIDYCAQQGCNNSGTCVNERGYSRCLCPPNYNGSRCEIDPCMSLEPCNNGTCILRSDFSYECDCHKGYTGLHCETGIIWSMLLE